MGDDSEERTHGIEVRRDFVAQLQQFRSTHNTMVMSIAIIKARLSAIKRHECHATTDDKINGQDLAVVTAAGTAKNNDHGFNDGS